MRIRPVTRGPLGGDAVYCAAYRGGRTLWNERTGDLYKYAIREDVRDTGIVLPQAHANDPDYDWAKDPYTLWNTAEFAEIQHNSRVARDYTMVLPEGMTFEQRREVVYRYAQALADHYGNAIDVALHDPRTGRARNYHAHLLATTRKVGPQGLLEKTDIELSGRGRSERGIDGTYADEQNYARTLWDRMLLKAVLEAGLPRMTYDTLYRAYGEGETTGQYQQRVAREGHDFRARQREDRRRTALTPEEQHESDRKKWSIHKYHQQQNKARQDRARFRGRNAERRASLLQRRPDHNKKLFIPRWDVRRGLLNSWEVEPQIRTKGQPQASFPLVSKDSPGPEPEFDAKYAPQPIPERQRSLKTTLRQRQAIHIEDRRVVKEAGAVFLSESAFDLGFETELDAPFESNHEYEWKEGFEIHSQQQEPQMPTDRPEGQRTELHENHENDVRLELPVAVGDGDPLAHWLTLRSSGSDELKRNENLELQTLELRSAALTQRVQVDEWLVLRQRSEAMQSEQKVQDGRSHEL